jgi:hypothetical protein
MWSYHGWFCLCTPLELNILRVHVVARPTHAEDPVLLHTPDEGPNSAEMVAWWAISITYCFQIIHLIMVHKLLLCNIICSFLLDHTHKGKVALEVHHGILCQFRWMCHSFPSKSPGGLETTSYIIYIILYSQGSYYMILPKVVLKLV